MKLTIDPRDLYGKKVFVEDLYGNNYSAIVDSYLYEKDNNGQDGISLSTGVWLDAEDIKSIEIIN